MTGETAVCLATIYGPDPQDCGDPATGSFAVTPLCARHLTAWEWADAYQDDEEEGMATGICRCGHWDAAHFDEVLHCSACECSRYRPQRP